MAMASKGICFYEKRQKKGANLIELDKEARKTKDNL